MAQAMGKNAAEKKLNSEKKKKITSTKTPSAAVPDPRVPPRWSHALTPSPAQDLYYENGCADILFGYHWSIHCWHWGYSRVSAQQNKCAKKIF